MLDLFGTLVDFHSVFITTLKRVMVDHDLIDQAEEFRERWQRFVFLGQAGDDFVTVREDFSQSLVIVLKDLGAEGDLVAYAHQVIDEMFVNLRKAELFPEVPAVIAWLEREGIPWAIVTNADEEDLQAIMSNNDMHPPVAISSERVRSYKPESEIFLIAIQELGVPNSRIIHVGDSPIADVYGASEVGIDTLWVNRTGMVYPDDLPKPDWNVPDLSGIPGLLLKG
jgi:2-haloalkanoic acid dehalogenase type II